MRGLRVDVAEREPVVAFGHDVGGLRPAREVAEEAIGGHGYTSTRRCWKATPSPRVGVNRARTGRQTASTPA